MPQILSKINFISLIVIMEGKTFKNQCNINATLKAKINKRMTKKSDTFDKLIFNQYREHYSFFFS